MIDLMCTQQIPNKYSNVAGVCKILHLSHSFHETQICVCVWLRVRPTQKRIGSRMQKSRFQPACMEQIYRHRLGAKIVSTPHFGASIHAKAFENSESCLLSPKLAATHISSISASGGACTIPTNLHCKSEKTEVILKSIECQKKQERDPPKWPRVTNKERTHQKKCRPQQPAVPSPRLDTLHQVAFWCCHGF